MAVQKALSITPVACRWRLSLFGPMRLDGPHGFSRVLRPTQTVRLLALLSDQPGRAVNKLELIAQFWPDHEPEAARNCLRVVVHDLRRLLSDPENGGPVLVSDHHTLTLVEGLVETDVSRFEEHLKGARRATDNESKVIHLDAAFREVRGEFLSGVDDPWALDRRRAIEDRLAEATIESVELLSKEGDPRRALDIARHVLKALRSREEVHVAVMRAYAYLGEPGEAYRQYDTLCTILGEEYGISPSPATDEALQNLPEAVAPVVKKAVVEPWTPERAPAQPFLVARFAGSSFVGREDLIVKIKGWLSPGSDEGVRVVCLTGLSGIGKTRLAVQLAQQMFHDYEDRVWFLTLEERSHANDVWRALAESMGLFTAPGIEPETKAREHLAEGPALLVLDECAHGERAHEEFLESLVGGSKDVRILYTSQSRLGTEAEQVVRVGPLTVPDRTVDRQTAETFESVQLFCERARSVDPTFSLTNRNVGAVVSVCQAVSGHPLAIGLAASRVNVCRVEDIVGRLADQTGLLSRRAKGGPARHASLASAIAWSASTLSEPESSLLRALTTFRQGFTLEAASFVGGQKDCMLDLATLVEVGLVERLPSQPNDRFELLGPVRVYAMQSAALSGESDEAKRLHLRYFADWSGTVGQAFKTGEASTAADLAALDLPNLLAAIKFAISAPGCADMAVRALGNLMPYFGLRGHSREWYEAARDLLALDGLDETVELAEAIRTFGSMAFFEREIDKMHAAYARLGEITLSSRHGPKYEGISLNGKALAARVQGRMKEAAEGYASAIRIVEKADLKDLASNFHYNLASLLEAEGDVVRARDHYERALTAAKDCEYLRFIGLSLDSLGRLRRLDGDIGSARALCLEAIEVLKSGADERAADYVLSNLAVIELESGNLDEAIGLASTCLDHSLSLREYREALGNLSLLADALSKSGSIELATLAVSGFRSIEKDLGVQAAPDDLSRLEAIESSGVVGKTKPARSSDRISTIMPLLELARLGNHFGPQVVA